MASKYSLVISGDKKDMMDFLSGDKEMTNTQGVSVTLDANDVVDCIFPISFSPGMTKICAVYHTRSNTPDIVTDWTAVAQNTIVKSAEANVSGSNGSLLYLQAFLDTTTAHTGTKFIVQMTNASTGNEDWVDLVEFSSLIGTSATDLIEDDPLAAGSTSITLTSHSLTTIGKWLAIEDATLVNSELIFESAQATNSITCLDGTTNAHAVNTAIFNVVMTQSIVVPPEVVRARVIVDNSYDSDGSSLNYKVGVYEL